MGRISSRDLKIPAAFSILPGVALSVLAAGDESRSRRISRFDAVVPLWHPGWPGWQRLEPALLRIED